METSENRENHAANVIWPLESIADVFRGLGCKHAMFSQIYSVFPVKNIPLTSLVSQQIEIPK
jgi:hypothetical protein